MSDTKFVKNNRAETLQADLTLLQDLIVDGQICPVPLSSVPTVEMTPSYYFEIGDGAGNVVGYCPIYVPT